MSVMPFFKNFFASQGENATRRVVRAMVELDPETASKADLMTMEQDLDRAGVAIAKLRADLTQEHHELDAVEAQYTELMGAAEVLKKRLEDPNTDHASVSASLDRLLAKIETMVPQLDRGRQMVKDTESLLHDAEAAYQTKAESLRSAKQNLEAAKHDLAHAKIEENRSKERAEQAAVVAGLKESPNNLTTALNSLQSATQDARQRAEANNMKASALSSAKESAEDKNIASALKEANPKTEKSLDERLSSLRR